MNMYVMILILSLMIFIFLSQESGFIKNYEKKTKLLLESIHFIFVKNISIGIILFCA